MRERNFESQKARPKLDWYLFFVGIHIVCNQEINTKHKTSELYSRQELWRLGQRDYLATDYTDLHGKCNVRFIKHRTRHRTIRTFLSRKSNYTSSLPVRFCSLSCSLLNHSFF
jgi:hypothetical protein